MTAPLVTVCIPTIGRTELVRETWRSLQQQSYSNIEILILDNASDPGSHRELAAMAASDARASILRLDARVPVFANFDRGRKSARGKYVTYFHDDDVYEPQFVAAHVAALESHPRASFSGSNCVYIDANGVSLGARRLVGATGTWTGAEFARAVFALGRNPVPFQSIMFRRESVPDGVFSDDEGPHYTDFVMLMRIAEGREVCMLSDPTVNVRLHSQRASAIKASGAIPVLERVLVGYLESAVQRGVLSPGDAVAGRRAIERSVMRATLLGWLEAESAADAALCVGLLPKSLPWRLAGVALTLASIVGLRAFAGRFMLSTLRKIVRNRAVRT